MSKILEFFGNATGSVGLRWDEIIRAQHRAYADKPCYKVRKSDPEVAIGTCSVLYGKPLEPIAICPTRLIVGGKIFIDCLHLLTAHEPGNDLHVVSEVPIPGGSIDYFLVSARDGKVKDFAGIELQTLDTTGTVWPERQRLLKELGVERTDNAETLKRSFGMNWKMTAKTILMQMHHKVQTFEHVHKKLVLVIQDRLLAYMSREFKFDHLRNPAAMGDSLHLHAYSLARQGEAANRLALAARLSTDADGIAVCLGQQAEARVELQHIVLSLQAKMSAATRFRPV